MVKDITIRGYCPTITSEDKAKPILDEDNDDEEMYVCSQCGVNLGTESDEITQAFRAHALKIKS
jgi:hypothetical protein